MLHSPRRTKHKYIFNNNLFNKTSKGLKKTLDYSIHIKSRTTYWLTPKHREIARRIFAKYIKRRGSLDFRFFPDIPLSKKPLQTRMGKGKGRPQVSWRSNIKNNQTILSFHLRKKIKFYLFQKLYKRVQYRLPLKLKLILVKKHKFKTDLTLRYNKIK